MRIDLSSPKYPDFYAKIDEEDFELVAAIHWGLLRSVGNEHLQYACGWKTGVGTVSLHRLVMRAAKGQRIDHINGDGLDCRKSNLRFCTHSENMANRSKSRSAPSSKYLGVYFDRSKSRYIAEVNKNGNRFRGTSKSEMTAARKYNDLALKHHGEFARLNIL